MATATQSKKAPHEFYNEEEAEHKDQPTADDITRMEKMAKYGAKVRKMLTLAFDPSADEGETLSAFAQTKVFMKKVGVTIEEMIRPEWGGGSLIVALQRVGQTVLPSGKYEGKTLTHVVDVDPNYLLSLHNSGGFRSELINKDLKIVADAWLNDFYCRFSGDWT